MARQRNPESLRSLEADTGIPKSTLHGRIRADRLSRLEATIEALAATVSRLAPAPEMPPPAMLAAAPYEPFPEEMEGDGTAVEYDDATFGFHRATHPAVGRRPSRIPSRVLVIGDSHWHPGIAKQTIRCMTLIGMHAASYKPDDIVHVGDGPDFDSVSKKPRSGVPQPDKTQDFRNNVANFRALSGTMDRGGVRARRHYCMGNHDQRASSFRGAQPDDPKSLAARHRRMFTDAGWTTTEFGEDYWLGGVRYTHRPLDCMGNPAGGKRPEQTIADESTRDCVFGDTHRYAVGQSLKLDGRMVTCLNAGTSCPEFFVPEYAQFSASRRLSYGCLELTDFDGAIQSHRYVTMRELELLYGAEADKLLGDRA